MLGDREATVVDVRPFDVHGVRHVDLTVAFDDGERTLARLGAESVPEGVTVGDRVLVRLVMSSIVGVERVP